MEEIFESESQDYRDGFTDGVNEAKEILKEVELLILPEEKRSKLVKEYEELSEKQIKLVKFLASDKFTNATIMQRRLLVRQFSVMDAYREILARRITADRITRVE